MAAEACPESILYPREYNQVNVGGTVTLMEAMRDVGVRRVVFASSGAVYGDQLTQPIVEGSIPVPRSPYAVSKLAAEYYINTIGDLGGLKPYVCGCSMLMVRGNISLQFTLRSFHISLNNHLRMEQSSFMVTETRLVIMFM